MVESDIKLARKEGAALRRVCCKPGQDIIGSKTLFNVDIQVFKRMTYQCSMDSSVGHGCMGEPGQMF